MQDYKARILLTGGAGFIGSNLLAAMLEDPRVELVRVLDDLSNGYYSNVEEKLGHPKFEFIQGSICDFESLKGWVKGCNLICHQAALGSVPRSIENPLRSHEVNVTGTLNILEAARLNGVDRVVMACSSSTYGDSPMLPKEEDVIGKPLSPYAVTKLAMEHYADVYQKVYGLNYVGLRYFNIFGPKQNPDNPYAAVIPLFCKAFLENTSPHINGDGLNSRDFTFVDNAVQANMLALFTDNEKALNQIYNVACGEQVSLIEMVELLNKITGKNIQPVFGPARKGDVKHSLASINKASTLLGYKPSVKFSEGLKKAFDWYTANRETQS